MLKAGKVFTLMILSITAAVLEVCPRSGRGAKEKGVKVVNKGTAEPLKMNKGPTTHQVEL